MKNKQQQYVNINIFWKDDNALSFSPLDHYRKIEKDGKEIEKFQGFKLKVTATNDLFETKFLFYVEKDEFFDLILFLQKKTNNIRFVRETKSITFSRLEDDNVLMKYDDKKLKNKLYFNISKLNQVLLYKIVITLLIKEIKAKNNLTFSKQELLDYIEDIVKDSKLQTSNNNATVNDKDKIDNGEWFYLSYINKYNDKEYTNKIKVSKEIYNYFKENKITDKNKAVVLKKIKQNNPEDSKFLTIENINTLKLV